MATLFDPLGFLSPYIILIKIIKQELPGEHASQNLVWRTKRIIDSAFKILKKNAQEKEKSIHIFSDASSEAYGAVAYQQCVYKSGEVTSCLVLSKVRVAPLKSISIPGLELLGPILRLQFAEKITGTLQMKMEDVTFYCDSMNVLWWIKNQSCRLKLFVANILGLIHSQTDPNQWRYIPTKTNIADLLTLDSTVYGLARSTAWWNGSALLNTEKETWPPNTFNASNDAKSELKKMQEHQTECSFPAKQLVEWQVQIDFRTGTNWVNWWVSQFLSNSRSAKDQRKQGSLDTDVLPDIERDYH